MHFNPKVSFLYKWNTIWLCIVVVWEKTTDVLIIAAMRHRIEPRVSITPSISHRLLFPITAIIKSERSQYFYFRNRFVLYIVFMRIKTPVKRHSLDVFQSKGLFFFCINEMWFDFVQLYPNGKVEGVACEFGELFSKKIRWKGLITDGFYVFNLC